MRCLVVIPGAVGCPCAPVVSVLCGILLRPRWVPCCRVWLVPRWRRVRCHVYLESWYQLMGPIGIGVLVRCMYSGLVGGLPFVARAAFLACVGGLAIIVCVCLW